MKLSGLNKLAIYSTPICEVHDLSTI